MIPRLAELEGLDATSRAFVDELPARGFGGDVRRDRATRLVSATDNSVYQILPQAVVYPRTTADLVAVMRLAAEPRFCEVTLAPRGGGTGTNGQSLGEGVIVDVSRHMNRILEVDLEAGWVRVEPGVVLDQLNDHLRPLGVFFAPNLSPSSRATLGGMIATDACGKGSRVYGRTSDHVLALTVVLRDGALWTAEALDERGLADAAGRQDAVGEVHRVVDDVVTRRRELIAEVFPRLRRFMTGYNLAMVRDEAAGTFDLCRLLAGSEGTLALTAEAKLRLTPIPSHRRLIVVKYATFDDALADAGDIVRADPGAIETLDETVLDLARQDVIWRRVADALEDGPDAPRTRAINLVEFEGDDPATVDAKADALLEEARASGGPASGATSARDAAEATALWELRKKGVGLLGNAPGARQPVAFVEDTVVPPERLPQFVREFRALLDEAGLRYGMFGHIDVGCLHVRPALDLQDPADERLLRTISDRVAALVQRHGGVMWGEHGKGFRSEYNPQFFGPELYEELRRIKAAFDPHDQLNPGKLAVPLGREGELVSVDGLKRGAFDRQIPAPVRDRWPVTLRCNGNGACFHYDPDHVMCPSSKVTRDRVHSPKGRAGVMREWLRQLTAAGGDPLAALRRPPGPGRLPSRAWHSLQRALGQYDYSHEVYDAMAGCLACKACATQCPIRVDVPAFRADFLALYHQRYLRPLKDHFVAALEGALPLLARAPRLANLLSARGPGRWLLARLVGIVDPPPLATPTARAGLAARGITPTLDVADADVAVVQDAFTTFYEPHVLIAAIDALGALGQRVAVLPYLPSGKGMHVRGFVRRFAAVAALQARRLRRVAAAGVPLVGLDPAVVLCFRDEYPHVLGEEATGFRVQLLQEHLLGLLGARLDGPAPEPDAHRWTLLGHCTERTAEPASAAAWQRVFRAAGAALDIAAVGCCGMCGAYGHEASHRAESEAIFRMGWERHLPSGAAERERVLATGHSCRGQVERFGGFAPRHPVEVIRDLLAPAPIAGTTQGAARGSADT